MFKFAVDNAGIYGGDDNAMRAANHELRGLSTVLGANIEGLHIPLMGALGLAPASFVRSHALNSAARLLRTPADRDVCAADRGRAHSAVRQRRCGRDGARGQRGAQRENAATRGRAESQAALCGQAPPAQRRQTGHSLRCASLFNACSASRASLKTDQC